MERAEKPSQFQYEVGNDFQNYDKWRPPEILVVQ